ncbi:hypothetical protein BTD24_004148, partial [Salmonella enterica subsp. enterica serovar Mbandaka]|nr:hypothetical protein [Salmonella enterica subsp. enterica serovar Mbandaka]
MWLCYTPPRVKFLNKWVTTIIPSKQRYLHDVKKSSYEKCSCFFYNIGWD